MAASRHRFRQASAGPCWQVSLETSRTNLRNPCNQKKMLQIKFRSLCLQASRQKKLADLATCNAGATARRSKQAGPNLGSWVFLASITGSSSLHSDLGHSKSTSGRNL